MKSIFKKVAVVITAAVLAFGTAGCSIETSSDISALALLVMANGSTKQTVATPVFQPAAGEVVIGTAVTLSCETEGAVIYYTTDGSEPTASSAEYSEAITLTEAQTIKAFAVKSGMNNSAVATAEYTLRAASTVFEPAEGSVPRGTRVKISCGTAGAKIYYTTDGSEPTASSTEYSEEIEITGEITIKAVAIKDGINNSEIISVAYSLKVAPPTFSPAAGEVAPGTEVTISCATAGADIYYTTDGSEPTASSTKYNGTAIPLTLPMTIKAIAVKEGMVDSAVTAAEYTKQTVAMPAFSPVAGEVVSGTAVELSCTTAGAKIYYTTDGTEPTASSTEYSTAITLTEPKTIKAIAVKEEMIDSAVASASYTLKVTAPAFSVAAGAVAPETPVTISCTTAGAKIYYTDDGSEPTAASTEYSSPISVTPEKTIKAIAVKDGLADSDVASVTYTKQTVATPTFSATGAVYSGTSVTISCSTEGATIYYTTDGSEPTTSSTEYTSAISVTPPMTIKAIAVKDGMNDSEVASAAYTLKSCVVGDFVLKDGTILSKDSTLTDTQKSNVAAVIVRAKNGNTPALGVGIVHSKVVWCIKGATGYNKDITSLRGSTTSGYMNGSNGWSVLNTAVSNDAANNPNNYPAWNFCKNYATGKGFSEALATGWYLPTLAELKTIYDNKTVVDTSLTKAGGNTFGTSFYWSCCQIYFAEVDRSYCAWALSFSDGGMENCYKDDLGTYVCSVRAFN